MKKKAVNMVMGMSAFLFIHMGLFAYADLVPSVSELHFLSAGGIQVVTQEVTITNNSDSPVEISNASTSSAGNFIVTGLNTAVILKKTDPGLKLTVTFSAAADPSKHLVMLDEEYLLVTIKENKMKYTVINPVLLKAYKGNRPVDGPTSVYFEKAKVGKISVSQSITLTNGTPFPLNIQIDPNKNPGFALDPDQVTTLAPNQAGTFSVHVQPSMEGSMEGRLLAVSPDSQIGLVTAFQLAGMSVPDDTVVPDPNPSNPDPVPMDPMPSTPKLAGGGAGCQFVSMGLANAWDGLMWATLLGFAWVGHVLIRARHRR